LSRLETADEREAQFELVIFRPIKHLVGSGLGF